MGPAESGALLLIVQGRAQQLAAEALASEFATSSDGRERVGHVGLAVGPGNEEHFAAGAAVRAGAAGDREVVRAG